MNTRFQPKDMLNITRSRNVLSTQAAQLVHAISSRMHVTQVHSKTLCCCFRSARPKSFCIAKYKLYIC